MDSSESPSTPSSSPLCNCTTSSACCRNEKPENTGVPTDFGECSKNAREAVTAINAVLHFPDSRSTDVACDALIVGTISSMLKYLRASSINFSTENDANPCTTRCVGKITIPLLFI